MDKAAPCTHGPICGHNLPGICWPSQHQGPVAALQPCQAHAHPLPPGMDFSIRIYLISPLFPPAFLDPFFSNPGCFTHVLSWQGMAFTCSLSLSLAVPSIPVFHYLPKKCPSALCRRTCRHFELVVLLRASHPHNPAFTCQIAPHSYCAYGTEAAHLSMHATGISFPACHIENSVPICSHSCHGF